MWPAKKIGNDIVGSIVKKQNGNLEENYYEIVAEVGNYIIYCDTRIYKGYYDEKEE